MPRIQRSLIAFAFLLFLVSTPKAFAVPGLELGVMAGAAVSFPGSGVDGGAGVSAGASASLGPVEGSLLYSQFKLSGPGFSATVNNLEIPVLYRLGLGPLSVGAGGFYSLFLSGSTSGPITLTEESNYGAVASARFTIPVTGVFFDARYNLGLKDTDGSKASSAAFYVGINLL